MLGTITARRWVKRVISSRAAASPKMVIWVHVHSDILRRSQTRTQTDRRSATQTWRTVFHAVRTMSSLGSKRYFTCHPITKHVSYSMVDYGYGKMNILRYVTTSVCIRACVSVSVSVSIVFLTLFYITSIYASPWVEVYYSLQRFEKIKQKQKATAAGVVLWVWSLRYSASSQRASVPLEGATVALLAPLAVLIAPASVTCEARVTSCHAPSWSPRADPNLNPRGKIGHNLAPSEREINAKKTHRLGPWRPLSKISSISRESATLEG